MQGIAAKVHATQDMEDRGFVLVDVRAPEAFAKGHLPGALNIPTRQLTAQPTDLLHPSELLIEVPPQGVGPPQQHHAPDRERDEQGGETVDEDSVVPLPLTDALFRLLHQAITSRTLS